MTIEKVVDYFLKEYNEVINNSYIQKPIAYALYKTWKWVDKQEKSRKDKQIK